MAYIGRSVDIGMFEKQVLTADSSTTTFTLTFAVGSANSLLVVYGGVIQEPAVAYSVSGGGQQIVFSEAPVTGTTTYIIYLGKQLTTPRAAGQETTKQTFTGNGSTVTYTLTDPPVVPAGIMVFVDGILQREGSGNNYVSSGSTITFSTAPDTSAEIDVYTLVKEKVSIDTVADGSITFAKLVAGSPTWNGAGETVIATASSGNSLRITNTGSGNSLLVEDSASTDSSPFVITAAGDVGIGTASPTSKLHVLGSTSDVFRLERDASNQWRFQLSAGALLFSDAIAATERMRIDSSGNLGLGVTPSAWDTFTASFQIAGASLSGLGANNTALASNAYYQSAWKYYGTGSASLYQQNAGQHVWSVAGSGTAGNAISFTQAMTLNASGNVLVGTTSLPTGGGILTASSSAAETKVSIVNTGTSGRHYWLGSSNTSSGALGGGKFAIYDQTATADRLVIDSSGNVGIGTTSPASRLDIFTNNGGGSHYPITLSATNSASAKTNYTQIGFGIAQGVAGSETGGFEVKSLRNNTSVYLANYDGAAGSAAWKFYTEGSERMRITSSGQLQVGLNNSGQGQIQSKGATPSSGTNTYWPITISAGATADTGGYTSMIGLGVEGHGWSKGAIGYTRTGSYDRGYIGFYLNNTIDSTTVTLSDEKMRIDASGVGIGGNDASSKVYLAFSPASQVGMRFAVSSGTFTNPYVSFGNSAGNVIGTINSNNSTTSYNTSSDYRLKENIAPMTGALAKVERLKPVTYTWKDSGLDSQGFIAHEIQEVVPDCVTGEKDAVDEDGKPVHQGIDTSFLVATLTAAIQELKAIVDAQAVEIAALKAK